MIRLFYNYYEDKNPARKQEIDLCYKNNLANPLLNVVILDTKDRPTYRFFFDKINEITSDNDINIICNSDIFFDETISLTEKLMRKQVWALSRWDWKGNGTSIHFNRQDSQDTWIIRGKVENVYGDFPLGKRGCDNRIAHEFHKAGYSITNPSKTVKSHHVHNSNIRTYGMKDVVPPPYKTLPPEDLI
jgi:hypothetical protein